jgi:hypothetical protein
MRVLSPRMEPPDTVLDGSTASTATRWPWPIRYRPSASMKVLLPTPGTPLMPRRKALAGVRQQGGEQLVGLRAVVGPGGLQQGDGLGHGAALHGRAAVHDALQPVARNHVQCALRICSSTSLALAGIGVPGP